jgi:hypothetical protein
MSTQKFEMSPAELSSIAKELRAQTSEQLDSGLPKLLAVQMKGDRHIYDP